MPVMDDGLFDVSDGETGAPKKHKAEVKMTVFESSCRLYPSKIRR